MEIAGLYAVNFLRKRDNHFSKEVNLFSTVKKCRAFVTCDFVTISILRKQVQKGIIIRLLLYIIYYI